MVEDSVLVVVMVNESVVVAMTVEDSFVVLLIVEHLGGASVVGVESVLGCVVEQMASVVVAASGVESVLKLVVDSVTGVEEVIVGGVTVDVVVV